MSGVLSHRVLVVVLIGVLAVAGDACAQTTWYVDDDAPGDLGAGDPTVSDPNEDGSAAHPFDAIQEGINAADDGDTVVVQDGTYTGAGNRDLDFDGRLITVRSANGAASCVIDCQGAGRGFHFHNGETAAAVVEGFTITNGTGDSGGGMYNWQSSPTVTQCTFSGNTADYDGGGMFNRDSSPTVTHCTFIGNTAADGGGMYNVSSSPTVTQCTFSGNTAYGAAGMYNSYESSPTVTQCTFSGNTVSEFGGGMYNGSNTSPTVTQCTFSENTAWAGGGMLNGSNSSPTVTRCTFSGNEALSGGGGCATPATAARR
ncbi:MAG TPA: right-handed parallel beta-helix repeat-containing protein [Phycisphaerae bacterium]|nr:right-handed parallel beta-helix repeat-containing protein [Phycisphaerae bacterium]